MSREGALWIGGLEPYMDEEFIRNSLSLMGEDKILSIKVIKNKFTGVPASYGFINFEDDSCALLAMHKLNGKIIPNSTPAVRFKLNHNSTRLMPGEKDSSIWVGDLTPDVDDLILFKFFSSRFQSIKSAKVVLDQSGYSKGYGFIRFGNESEQQSALMSMMGVSGLGSKPIKVSLAIPKAKQAALASQVQQPATSQLAASIAASINAVAPNGSLTPNAAASSSAAAAANDYAASQQYWQSYNHYWSQYAAWSQQYSQQYYDQSGYYGHDESSAGQMEVDPASAATEYAVAVQKDPHQSSHSSSEAKTRKAKSKSLTQGDSSEIIYHTEPLCLEKMNKEFIWASEELWEAVEASTWWNNPAQIESPQIYC